MSANKECFANLIISEYIRKSGVIAPIEFHFVDNINDSWIFYTHSRKVKREYILQDFSQQNGLTLPFEGDTYHILIRNDYIDYKCTIIHESTHIIDYDRFRLLYNSGDTDIELHKFYGSMCLYSEFHARKMAHAYYVQNLFNVDVSQIMLQELLNIVPIIKDLEKDIKTNKCNNIIKDLRLYDLMQYLGRIYTIKLDIAPLDDFSDNIKMLYASLVALDKNWNDNTFQAVEDALRKLYE